MTIAWADYLKLGDGVIDIGANVGNFSKLFAEAVGPTGYVLAVEPDPANIAHLRKRTRVNPAVRIVEAAVTDVTGEALLYHDTNGARHSLWEANLLVNGKATHTVTTVTVDALAPQVPKLKAIKVDAQGAESLVLAGATETLKRDLVWHIEVWPAGLKHAGSSVKALLDVFRQAGYQPRNLAWDRLEKANFRSPHGAVDAVFTR